MSNDGMKVDVPGPLAHRLKAAAERSGDSVEALVGRALEAWLSEEAEDAQSVAELERRWAAIEAGEATVPHDAVVTWLETWGASDFRPWRDS